MMMVQALRAALVISLALTGLLLFQAARAAGFQVSPVRVDLSPEQSSSALTVRNDGDEPVIVQAQTMRWSQVGGRDHYETTTDILATPPIFTIKPGSTQILRVGVLRPPNSETELSYRLYLQEVPARPRPGFQGLQVALRLGIPVFARNRTRSSPDLSWKIEQLDGERVRVQLTNEGVAHVQVTDFSLVLPDGKGPVAAQQVSAYVLPMQQREWVLATTQAINTARIRIRAYTDVGKIDADVNVEKK
ncbi:molecular chaperone [Burkholderia sp. Ac-20345]|uniref:fimbrial biogenesis chaperone n=1 Tax=Burkholderia sp. Ac-20345 TaxID=2703891 RepID=UPI00197C0446|nr:molecular chaperone [Burkholderia sp. Ac-20345]MBN3781029.1 molecular chaperone [Burkholderia sp. Ac-20345]